MGISADVLGGVVSSVVVLGQCMDQPQSDSPIRDSTTDHPYVDRKILRKEQAKKIALGHKVDDHDQQGPSLSM